MLHDDVDVNVCGYVDTTRTREVSCGLSKQSGAIRVRVARGRLRLRLRELLSENQNNKKIDLQSPSSDRSARCCAARRVAGRGFGMLGELFHGRGS